MLEMAVQTLVNAIVDQELARKGNNEAGLLFSFDVSLCYYHSTDDDCKQYEARRTVHFFYQVNEGYCYINAFSAVSTASTVPLNRLNWTHEVTHDSCWRNDVKAFSDVYFEMAEEVNAELDADGLPRVAPKDMIQHIYPTNRLFSWVSCTVAKDPTDKHGHCRTLTLHPQISKSK